MLNAKESHKKLDWYARHYDYNVDYMREMLEIAPEAYATFEAFLPMANFVKSTPLEVMNVAKITAMKYQDCSDCFQLILDMAVEVGVDKEIIKSLVFHDGEGLSDELKDVRKFTLAVLENRGIDEELQSKMTEKYSRDVMMELGLAIASMQVFPIIRRTVNAFKSCNIMELKI